MILQFQGSYNKRRPGLQSLDATSRTLCFRPVATNATLHTPVVASSSAIAELQCSNIVAYNGDEFRHHYSQQLLSFLPVQGLPGPSSIARSSGSDFIDLVQISATEAFYRLQDAKTFQLLGCGAGALDRVHDTSAAPIFNIRKLKAFRDNVTRNLAPTVAHGFLEARRARLAVAVAALSPGSVSSQAPAVTAPAFPPISLQHHAHTHSPVHHHSSSSLSSLYEGAAATGYPSRPATVSAPGGLRHRISNSEAWVPELLDGDGIMTAHGGVSMTTAVSQTGSAAATWSSSTSTSSSGLPLQYGAGGGRGGELESVPRPTDLTSSDARALLVGGLAAVLAAAAAPAPTPLPAALVPIDEDDVEDLLRPPSPLPPSPTSSGLPGRNSQRRRRGSRRGGSLEYAGRRQGSVVDDSGSASAAWI